MLWLLPVSTRTGALVPCTTLFRSRATAVATASAGWAGSGWGFWSNRPGRRGSPSAGPCADVGTGVGAGAGAGVGISGVRVAVAAGVSGITCGAGTPFVSQVGVEADAPGASGVTQLGQIMVVQTLNIQ